MEMSKLCLSNSQATDDFDHKLLSQITEIFNWQSLFQVSIAIPIESEPPPFTPRNGKPKYTVFDLQLSDCTLWTFQKLI